MLEYSLTYKGETITLKNADCPANVNSFTMQLSRHKRYGSVISKYTISDQFHGRAKQFIDNAVALDGWNSEITVNVSYVTTFKRYEIIKNGSVTLKNYNKKELYTECSLEDSSFERKVINNEDVEVDYNSDTDLEGKSIATYLTPTTSIILRGIGGEKSIKAIYPIHAFEKVLRIITGEAYPVNTAKSDIISLTPFPGKIAQRMLATGRMVRGYDQGNIPMSFMELFDSLNAQNCIGLGFEKTSEGSRVVIADRESFYPQIVVAEINEVSNLEYGFDPDLLYKKLTVGYSNFEKKENIYGQSEYNNKSIYATHLNQFDKSISLVSKIRADGTSLERLRTLEDNNESDNLDDELFFIDCVKVNDVLTSRKLEGFQEVGGVHASIELYTNLDLSPARCLKRHERFLTTPFIYDRSKYLKIQKTETLSKLETRKPDEATAIKDGTDIQANTLELPIFSGRVIKCNVTFTPDLLDLIINSPNGLLKILSYTEKKHNFGFIKELRLDPDDEEHNLELLEVYNYKEFVNIGYLLTEDGRPILTEDGRLIQIEGAMEPIKGSQLPDKNSLDDNDYVILISNGVTYKTTGAALKESLSLELNEVQNFTIPANTTDYVINLGQYSSNKTYWINYESDRDTRKRAGLLIIKAMSSTIAKVTEPGLVIFPETFEETGGITDINADVSSNQVRLKITTDNADATNTTLKLIVKAL